MSDTEERAREMIHGLVTGTRAQIHYGYEFSADDPDTNEVLVAAIRYAVVRITQLLYALGEYSPGGQELADRLWREVSLSPPDV